MYKNLLMAFVAIVLSIHLPAQKISFSKFKELFRSQSENKIRSFLKGNGFIVQPEEKSTVAYFDTQIIGYWSAKQIISEVVGMNICKKDGLFRALVYFTTIQSLFESVFRDCIADGFELKTHPTKSSSVYTKGDTILTSDKIVINVEGKDYIRYELGLMIVNFGNTFFKGVYTSKNNFSLEIPEDWELIWGQSMDSIKMLNEKTKNLDIELVGHITSENRSWPTIMVSFAKLDKQEKKGFQESVKSILSDEFLGQLSKAMGKKFPNASYNLNPQEPIIDAEKRQVTIFSIAQFGTNRITTIQSLVFLEEGMAAVVLYVTDDELEKYQNEIANCIRSFKIKEGHKLIQD